MHTHIITTLALLMLIAADRCQSSIFDGPFGFVDNFNPTFFTLRLDNHTNQMELLLSETQARNGNPQLLLFTGEFSITWIGRLATFQVKSTCTNMSSILHTTNWESQKSPCEYANFQFFQRKQLEYFEIQTYAGYYVTFNNGSNSNFIELLPTFPLQLYNTTKSSYRFLQLVNTTSQYTSLGATIQGDSHVIIQRTVNNCVVSSDTPYVLAHQFGKFVFLQRYNMLLSVSTRPCFMTDQCEETRAMCDPWNLDISALVLKRFSSWMLIGRLINTLEILDISDLPADPKSATVVPSETDYVMIAVISTMVFMVAVFCSIAVLIWFIVCFLRVKMLKVEQVGMEMDDMEEKMETQGD